MGSFGRHRRQTQILNHQDSCCFVPPDSDAVDYTCEVHSRLFSLGAGAFTLDYDGTATSHQISLPVLSGIILRTLEVGSAGMAPVSFLPRFSWPSGALVHIVKQHSGKCVDEADASAADHARVEQWRCHHGKNQIWVLQAGGEIVSLNSGKCLDVPPSPESH